MGFVAPPMLVQPDLIMYYCLSILAVVFAYYYITFTLTRVPIKHFYTENPDEFFFSPAATRYIYYMRYDYKTLTASLFRLAIEQYLVFDSNLLSIFIIPKNKPASDNLGPEETSTLENLSQLNTIDLSRGYKKSLASQFKNKYFVNHSIYVAIGILLSITCIGLLFFTQFPEDYGKIIMPLFFLCVFTIGLIKAFENLIAAMKNRDSYISFFLLLGIAFVCFFITFIFFASLYILGGKHSILIIPVLATIYATNYIFWKLLPAPTLEGAIAQGKIENLRLFLMKKTPTKNNETFEKYLSYAIALNLDRQWCESMSPSYDPRWIQGRKPLKLRNFILRVTAYLKPYGKKNTTRLNISTHSH